MILQPIETEDGEEGMFFVPQNLEDQEEIQRMFEQGEIDDVKRFAERPEGLDIDRDYETTDDVQESIEDNPTFET